MPLSVSEKNVINKVPKHILEELWTNLFLMIKPLGG